MRETTLSRAIAASDARAYDRVGRERSGSLLVAVSTDEADATQAPVLAAMQLDRQRLSDRSAIRLAARVLDATGARAVTILLYHLAHLNLTRAPFAAAASCLALPAAGLTGVWLTGGYRAGIPPGQMSLTGGAVSMTAAAIEMQGALGDHTRRHRMKPGLTGGAWRRLFGVVARDIFGVPPIRLGGRALMAWRVFRYAEHVA